MAYALVASSGLLKAANLTWTHTFTQDNLVTVQAQNDSGNTPGASDFKDSSGTPKTLTRDVVMNLTTLAAAANYSLVVPSGFTSPLKGATVVEEWMAAEWSGNATSSVLDTSNSATSTPANGTTSFTGATINTGANAGLVLVAFSNNVNTNAAQGITITGTSFTDTYSSSHDGTDSNNSASDAGSAAYRTASCNSQTGLGNTWTSTSASGTGFGQANVISSYNAVAGAAAQTPYQPWYQRAPILAM